MNTKSVKICVAAAAAAVVGCATTETKFNGPKPGETWHVSTEHVTVRQSPSELSPAVRTLSYRDAVTVEKDVRVAPPFAGDRNLFPEDLIPGWVQLRGGGYLAVPSLASAWLIDNQDPNEQISAEGMTAAKRGFSESESDAELASMRGAAGAGKASAVADPAAVERILAARRSVSDAAIASFVQKGGLKGNPAKPEILNIEKPMCQIIVP